MPRLPFIDWVRGFAVVAMVLWHTGDGWVTSGLRSGQGWSCLRFVGGLAAPTFLLLAGVGTALAVRDTDEPAARARSLRGALARGLEIVLFGYVLRFQTWMLDAGAATHASMARAFVPLGAGYGALAWAARQLGDRPRTALWWGALGAALSAAGLLQVESVAAGRLTRLLQVDVLQAIGSSLCLLAFLHHRLALWRHPGAALCIGAGVACSTHFLWMQLPGPVPHALAGYLGKYEVEGVKSSLFPLFPWFSYACFGSAVGSMLRQADSAAGRERATVSLGLLGAVLALGSSEAHAYVRDAIAAQPWSTHPIRVVFRVGIVLSLFIPAWAWAEGRASRILIDYGRASLRIYWAHMLFAYGVLGRALQKSAGYPRWATWATLLLFAMWMLTQIQSSKRSPARS